MTDTDLKKQLSALVVPPVNGTSQARAFHRASIAFAQPDAPLIGSRSRSSAWLTRAAAWCAGSALAAVAIGAFWFSHGPSAPSGDLQTLAQLQTLFPGQLNAVIEHDGATQLDLGHESKADGASQPLVLVLERGGQRMRILSYSGRRITLDLKGARLSFEALITGDGGVVLLGNDFAWSSAKPGLLGGYRIEAHPLTRSL